MKRILYVEGCLDGTVGGSHTCLFSMVSNLNRRNFYPIVIFYYENIISYNLRRKGIETHILKYFKMLNLKYLGFGRKNDFSILNKCILLCQKCLNFFIFLKTVISYVFFLYSKSIDIVHLNNSLSTNHDWMIAAKLLRIKCVCHERGINQKLSKTSIFLAKRLDAIICISSYISKNLKKQGIRPSKLRIIYDGVDISRTKIKIDRNTIRKKIGIRNSDKVIGVVGNIKTWKGQKTVVLATAILKNQYLLNLKCILVGGWYKNDKYFYCLKNIIEKYKILDNVIFTGFSSNPIDYMNIMDVVVHSSIEPEPFGMVNLEAMYLKKPVISTNIGGPTEIFNNGKDGILIEPGNPNLLADTIYKVLSNKVMMEKFGINAHSKVIKKFNALEATLQCEQLYIEKYPK